MKSHEYAKQLRQLADFLEDRPAFILPDYTHRFHENFMYFEDKKSFLSAVRALGSLSKDFSDDTYLKVRKLLDGDIELSLSVNRDAVCRLVKPAEYECEPLLSQEEMAEIA